VVEATVAVEGVSVEAGVVIAVDSGVDEVEDLIGAEVDVVLTEVVVAVFGGLGDLLR